jgi:hypothetical protein
MENFTTMQQALILNLASGMEVKAAMSAAGYSKNMRPAVVITPAMQGHLRQLMVGELALMAPKALSLLCGQMDDEEASAKIRLDAAKTILDRAGFVPPKAPEATTMSEKSLHEMTRSELAERVQRLHKDISENRTVTLDG